MAVNGETSGTEVNVPAATFDTILVLDFGYAFALYDSRHAKTNNDTDPIQIPVLPPHHAPPTRTQCLL